MNCRTQPRAGWLLPLNTMLGLCCWSSAVQAHQGPPFPIVVDERVGPYVVSVWTHPDIGTGTFFVNLDAPTGASLPEGTTVQVCVQPVSGRLPETCYLAERQANRDHEQYYAEVQFDAKELWRVRVTVQGPQGGGEAHAEVEATPAGFGAWDLVIYAFPFVFLAGFLIYGVVRRRAAAGPVASEELPSLQPTTQPTLRDHGCITDS